MLCFEQSYATRCEGNHQQAARFSQQSTPPEKEGPSKPQDTQAQSKVPAQAEHPALSASHGDRFMFSCVPSEERERFEGGEMRNNDPDVVHASNSAVELDKEPATDPHP